MILFSVNIFSVKNIFKTLVLLTSVFLSACVTQEFNADNSLVIENPVSNDEKAMTRIQLGLGYLKMGNTTQAKLNLEKAKHIAPNLVQVYTAFAHYYDKVGEADLTIQAYEKALALKSDDADTLNNYGVFLCSQNKIDEAEKQLLKAITVPSYLLVSQSYENIALCQLKVNNFVKAEKYLKKAIEHSPNNASAVVKMAQLQYAKKDYLKAEHYLKRFEKVTRKFSPIPLALAYKVYRKLGKNSEAKNYVAMLVKMYPQSQQSKQYLHNGLAHIYADSLALKYQQSLAPIASVKTKKKVIKLSPRTAKVSPPKAKKIPFKVTSELSRLPISRSVDLKDKSLEKAKSIEKSKTPAASTTLAKSKTNNNKVISDEAIDALINEPVISKKSSTSVTNVEQSVPKISDKVIADLVTENVAANVNSNDEKVSNTVADKSINDLVAEEITTPAKEDKKLTTVTDADENAQESNSATEHANNSITDITSEPRDETDIAIDEAINNLVNDKSGKAKVNRTQLVDVAKQPPSVSAEQVEQTKEDDSAPLTYKIQKDQNLFYVSRTYNIRLSALRRWNNLTKNSVLQVGDVIYLTDPAELKASKKVQVAND